jgi:hypothetical protein
MRPAAGDFEAEIERGKRKARTLDKPSLAPTLSYSSNIFSKSSSDLTDTKASRSSLGNWHFSSTAEEPKTFDILAIKSAKPMLLLAATTLVFPPA